MTIFDLPPSLAALDLQQWEPILQWLRPVLYPPQAANDSAATGTAQHVRTGHHLAAPAGAAAAS